MLAYMVTEHMKQLIFSILNEILKHTYYRKFAMNICIPFIMQIFIIKLEMWMKTQFLDLLTCSD